MCATQCALRFANRRRAWYTWRHPSQNFRILLVARAVTGVPLRHKHEKSDGTERLGRPSLCLLEGGPVRKGMCGVVSLYVDIP